MITDLVLRCPSCDRDALADDEYCESCGMALGVLRDARRNHFEIETDMAAGVSDRGLVHTRNEDALFLDTFGRATVAVVCDGVSTSAAPQVAAQVAARKAGAILVERLAASPGSDVKMMIVDAVADAAAEVLDVPWMQSAGVDAPSCTIVAAVWDGSMITVGWSGDSRAYWIGSDGVLQLTSDHSWAQSQVDAGLAERDTALADPRAHAITRWLGPDAPTDPPPIATYQPHRAGRLVVCSDGLWNYLQSAEDLTRCAAPGLRGQLPIDVARSLTSLALERGGHDNITVAVIDVSPAPLPDNDQEAA